jgi:excisionase family DNA binding protein
MDQDSGQATVGLLLRKTELARLLGCSPRTVENMVRGGRLPAPIYVVGPQSPRWRRCEVLHTLGLVQDTGVQL